MCTLRADSQAAAPFGLEPCSQHCHMLCSYWKKAIPLEELLAVNNEAEKLAWKLQADAGVPSLHRSRPHHWSTLHRVHLCSPCCALVMPHLSGNHLVRSWKHGGMCSAHRITGLVACRHQPDWSGWNSVRPGPGHHLLPGPCPCPVLCEYLSLRPNLISLHSPVGNLVMQNIVPFLLRG